MEWNVKWIDTLTHKGIATATSWIDFYWVSLWPQTKSKTLLLSLWKIAVWNVKIISCEHTYTQIHIYTPVTHWLGRRESLYWLHRRILFLNFYIVDLVQLSQLSSTQFNLILRFIPFSHSVWCCCCWCFTFLSNMSHTLYFWERKNDYNQLSGRLLHCIFLF